MTADNDRIGKLEEAHAFAERNAEQLNAELLRAFREIERLRARLADLEGRLVRLAEQEFDGE